MHILDIFASLVGMCHLFQGDVQLISTAPRCWLRCRDYSNERVMLFEKLQFNVYLLGLGTRQAWSLPDWAIKPSRVCQVVKQRAARGGEGPGDLERLGYAGDARHVGNAYILVQSVVHNAARVAFMYKIKMIKKWKKKDNERLTVYTIERCMEYDGN